MKFDFQKNHPKGPYEVVAVQDWTNWKWQLKNALKSKEQFAQIYKLTDAEVHGFENTKNLFQIRSTPYYASLGSYNDPHCPVRLMQAPLNKEMSSRFQEMLDPLDENKNSVTPRLIHRYPDRVLFLVTDFCSVYCRYCTRKRFTGKNHAVIRDQDYIEAIDYINRHKGIREVILSGGDPLTLDDERLKDILLDLKNIEHVELVRIGSRMPVVNPFRITDNLLNALSVYKPLYIMNHFNHPQEITHEAASALDQLASRGFPLMNQMVLLNGINNHPAVVQALSRRLLRLRVKPYYMFQCDPSIGTDHLRTSITDSLSIQKELWGNLSGLAMPHFSIDIPGGGGKVSLSPNYLKAKNDNEWLFQGFDGVQSRYIDPSEDTIIKPQNIEAYIREWQELCSAKSCRS